MRELIIEKQNNIRKIFLLENGNIVEKYIENEVRNSIEGNIYLRKN